jgi:hypothetical protein
MKGALSRLTGRRPGITWWVSALVLVTVGWLVTPQAVTVYDGVGQPDEPYRYVSAPPGAKVSVKAPTGAKAVFPVAAGVNPMDQTLVSTESGPQVSVFLPEGGLNAASGTITATVTPEAATDPPTGGRLDGNVYRLSITNPTGPVTATIYLRATTAAQPPPVIEHRSAEGQAWRPLKTSRVGNEIYLALIHASGDYGVVFQRAPARPDAAATDTGGSHQGLIVGLLVSFLLLLSVVLAVRWRAREPAP